MHLLATITGVGERGVGFVSLTEAHRHHPPAGGLLLLGIMASLPGFERDQLRDRTTAGLAAAGSRVGRRR